MPSAPPPSVDTDPLPATLREQLAQARLLCTQLAQDLASHRRDRTTNATQRLRRLVQAFRAHETRRAKDPVGFDSLMTGLNTTLDHLDAALARKDDPDFANRREALDLLLLQLDRFAR